MDHGTGLAGEHEHRALVEDPSEEGGHRHVVNAVGVEVPGSISRAVGCAACGAIGFKGRKAIFEMMVLNAEIRELAFNRANIAEVRDAAIRGGMRTLLGDGKLKILRGDTTPEEVAKFAQADSPTASQFVVDV